MTHAFTQNGKKNVYGNRKSVYGELDITSYGSSTGEALTAGEFGLKRIDGVDVYGVSDNGHEWRWDSTNAKMRCYKLNAGVGVTTESFPDASGGNAANQTSSGSAGTNDAFIIAAAAANTTAKTTIAAQPNTAASLAGNAAAGRNVKVVFSSAGGGTLPANMGTATVVGTDQFGAALTRAISLSALNSVAISAGEVVWVVDADYTFATVTSLTLSVNVAATVADAQVSLGLGTIFGLRGKITAESDIKSVRTGDDDVASTTYVGSATGHSLDMGANVADNTNIIITYDALASSLIDREAASTADVGACFVEVLGI